MTTRQLKVHSQLGQAAAKIFAANDRINQMLIDHLDPTAWNAKPPGGVRSIAAIFTHMHNVRAKWIRLTAPHLKVPAQLNRANCTPRQVRAGLARSAAGCAEMLSYMLAHEAHHRGQVCMIAHQLGYRLTNKVTSDLWNWEKLLKQ